MKVGMFNPDLEVEIKIVDGKVIALIDLDSL